jgi:hypothetical protein
VHRDRRSKDWRLQARGSRDAQEHFSVTTRRQRTRRTTAENRRDEETSKRDRARAGTFAQRDAAECAEGTRTSREADRSGESLGENPRSIPVMHRIRRNAVRLSSYKGAAPSATPDAEAHAADNRSCFRRETGECVRRRQLRSREEDATKPIGSRKAGENRWTAAKRRGVSRIALVTKRSTR